MIHYAILSLAVIAIYPISMVCAWVWDALWFTYIDVALARLDKV